MRYGLPGWIVPCSLALGFLGSARAEALRPSAARRVEDNAVAVTTEFRDVIAASTTAEGEQLRSLVNSQSARWGIRYRDGYLLFSIPVRKNLTIREKRDGEQEAADLAVVTLAQKFSRLLELEDPSQGLDPASVRVVFIEPDAEIALAGWLGTSSHGAGRQMRVGPPSPAVIVGSACQPCQPAPVATCGCQ